MGGGGRELSLCLLKQRRHTTQQQQQQQQTRLATEIQPAGTQQHPTTQRTPMTPSQHCHQFNHDHNQSLLKITREFGATRRVAESAANAVRFGVDPSEAVLKVEALIARLGRMEEVSTLFVSTFFVVAAAASR